MPKLGWYLKRVRVMSGREILHRLSQAGTTLSLLVQHRLGLGMAHATADPAQFDFCSARQPQLPPVSLDMAALRDAAGPLTKGQINVAGRTWQWNDSLDCWHRALDSDQTWPSDFFGRIPYLHGNPYGEVRQLWEPSRLQQLVDLAALAQAGDSTQRDQAIYLVEAQLQSWVRCNPPLSGPHYISSMECGLRLMAVCHALDMLRADVRNPTTWQALVRIVESHVPLIERRLSLYSSTGNHTVAEAGGLVYAGLLFPELPGSRRRLESALALLAALAQSQVLPDGGGLEQAPAYHQFNIHVLGLVESLLRWHGSQVPAAISDAVARGSRFLQALEVGHGGLPPIGDDDGGHALSRFLRLAPGAANSSGHAISFEQSGYTVARIATAPVARIIFDHGPLGMPPSCGHGHADALSLQLYVKGAPVLIDPGTYTYTGEQDWRRHFRGTRSHNTVTVDGLDQARQEGSFMWSRPFDSRVIAQELEGNTLGRILAEHDGYREIGVRHVRGIAWQRDSWLYIWDALLGVGEHECELHWHLGSKPTAVDASTFRVPADAGAVSLHCTGGLVSMHSAERAPIRGWQSPAYGVLEAGHTLRVSFRGPMPHAFQTLIQLGGDKPPAEWLAATEQWMQDLSR